jgi:CRISPR-associated protein Cas2
MSRHRRPVLICYDIADPRRLRRAFRELRDAALPVQKSVFVAALTEAELERLLERLAESIDVEEDCLQVFRLRTLHSSHGLGRTAGLKDTWVA